VFFSYWDESSDEHQKKIFVIAGFVGRYEEWARIEWRWKQLLDKYELEYYCATEAEHARGQFDKPPFRAEGKPLDYTQNEMLRRVCTEFLDLFASGIIFGVGIGIPMQDFFEVANTPERLARFGGTPYYLSGHMAMLATLIGIKNELRNKELVSFMLDRQDQFKTEMEKVHAALASKGSEFHSQVGSLRFADKRDFIPLQVADTLAYEVRKTLENAMQNPNALDSS
jgi:hypothetical protein